MRTLDIEEAKLHLSELVREAAAGEPFVITEGGEAKVRVEALAPFACLEPPRLGFMRGQGVVPETFDRTGDAEIEALFENAG